MTDAGSEPAETHVYVNDRGTMVARGSSALDAVRQHSAAQADAVAAGTARLTDSRGLPIDSMTPVYGGLILRVLPVRAARVEPIDGDAPAAADRAQDEA